MLHENESVESDRPIGGYGEEAEVLETSDDFFEAEMEGRDGGVGMGSMSGSCITAGPSGKDLL